MCSSTLTSPFSIFTLLTLPLHFLLLLLSLFLPPTAMANTAPPPRMPHILLFPWPTQGHINPFMLLATYLSSRHGLLITFLHTARNFSLLQRAHKQQQNLIRFEVLPDGMHTHDAKQRPTEQEVLASVPIMEEGLHRLMERFSREENPVSCVISDSFLPWTQDVADRFGVPRIEFWSASAIDYCIGSQLPQLISKGYLPVKGSVEDTVIDCIPGIPPFVAAELPKEYLDMTDISDPVIHFFIRAFSRTKEAERLLVHSSYVLETSSVEALKAEQKNVYLIGPLYPVVFGDGNGTPVEDAGASLLPADAECLRWLDTQAKSSVIYVSFGSAASLSPEETQELALGLESSEQPFLWVIRPDCWKGSLSDILPTGFQSRTRERSRIISWAPQLAVLSHASVGGFLTHCGWNSTMESLWEGVAMVGCPREAEQRMNARLVAKEWKVGMELEREEGGGLGREGVERAVRVLMQGEEGREARRRACEMKVMLRDGMKECKRNLEEVGEDIRKMVGGHS